MARDRLGETGLRPHRDMQYSDLHLLPRVHGKLDLGSLGGEWRRLYVSEGLYLGGSPAHVPSGAMCYFATTPPEGWAEYTAAMGRVIVGVPSGGTVAGTVGTALANLGSRTITDVPSHSHGVGTLATGDQSASHTHSVSAGNQSADHTHSGTTSNQSADHTHGGTTGNESANHTHSGTTGNQSGGHTHGVSITTGNNSVGHTHSVSITTGTQSAGHTHNVNIGSFSTGNATHSHYLRVASTVGSATWALAAQQAGSVQNGWDFYLTGTGDHSHSVDPPDTTSSGISANHTHSVSGNTGGVSANHTHGVSGNTGDISANHTHSITTGNQSVSHTHNFTTGGMSASHTHTVTTGGISANHTHAMTVGNQSASHNHALSGSTAAAGSASVDVTMPYIQLRLCQKL